MGNQIAVGFKDGIKMYYIMLQEIVQACDITTKASEAMKYSTGGHLLAVAAGDSVYIINPITYEAIRSITKHPGIIKSIRWFNDDTLVLSSCSLGTISSFNLAKDCSDIQFMSTKTK